LKTRIIPLLKAKTGTAIRYLQTLPVSIKTIVITVTLAAAAGLSAVAFLWSTNALFNATILSFARHSSTFFTIASLITMIVAGTVVTLLLRIAPDAAGSGIPQLKAAYWKGLGHMPLRTTITKFFAGLASLGGGFSLSAGLASWLSGFFGFSKRKRRTAATVGAAAGLAAAFNTPLAAITFVFEEIVGDFNSRTMGNIVLASLVGAVTVQVFLGSKPAFMIPAVDKTSWVHFALVVLVAALATSAGIFFQRMTLGLRKRLKSQTKIPQAFMPVIGGIATWCVAITAFFYTGHTGIFSLGYKDLSDFLTTPFVWNIALVLLAGKVFATVLSYGFGGCGGIFSPMLFIGGMSGGLVAGVAAIFIPLRPEDFTVLAAVGMSTCLGALIRAPLTSMLIVFEMTHEFAFVPGLMLGTIISQALTRLTSAHNFYDALLLQDGHELIKIKPPRDLTAWFNCPVSQIANYKPRVVVSFEKSAIEHLLHDTPYKRFPVQTDDGYGVISREKLTASLAANTAPQIENAVFCSGDQTVREIADSFIRSSSGMLLVLNRADRSLAGIITLHDLLRAEASLQE
jgi:CIC family chloride channel protein